MTKRKSSNPRYAGERIIKLGPVNGVETRFVEWYNPKVGLKNEVACAFQVLIRGKWRELRRYDSDHGVFHRHKDGWPEPGAQDLRFEGVPMGERGATALNDVKQNIALIMSKIPKEVLEDDAAG